MSCNVDVDIDADEDVDFERWNEIYLQIAGIDTRSFSDELIDSITSLNIELRKTLIKSRILINGGRIWLLYCVVGFVFEDDYWVPIRMNAISFLFFILTVTIVNLEVNISTSYTLYWTKMHSI